ncbi:hypothetical protein ACFFX0_09130 [Citricoccus parietis]|uniref:Uncharacterized protein n=1 Tax=Citricoccus parietis TaxID=592307 RepID=A0ABV5FXD8_9MICC
MPRSRDCAWPPSESSGPAGTDRPRYAHRAVPRCVRRAPTHSRLPRRRGGSRWGQLPIAEPWPSRYIGGRPERRVDERMSGRNPAGGYRRLRGR